MIPKSMNLFLLVIVLVSVSSDYGGYRFWTFEKKSPENTFGVGSEIQHYHESFLRRVCPHLRYQLYIGDYRFHSRTNYCYQIGRQGPCGRNMKFYQEPNNRVLGVCDCDADSPRTLIYVEGKCYFIFQQGVCRAGYWLTLDQRGNPICERNPCSATQHRIFQNKMRANDYFPELVWFNNRCVELGSRTHECPNRGGVGFVKGRISPTCTDLGYGWESSAVGKISPGEAAIKCPPGSWRAVSGRCVPSWTW